jgi:hypothetical protein
MSADLQQLQDIVDALAACDPIAVDCSAWCPLCGGGGVDGNDVYDAENVVHLPSCPWILAQAAKSETLTAIR